MFRSFVAVTGLLVAGVLPVWGDVSTEKLGHALDLVQQVEKNTDADAQRIDLLTQAIAAAQAAPDHRLKGHRVLAIQAIRSAIGEIRTGDANHQVAVYLHTAETELNASLSLVEEGHPVGPTSVTSLTAPSVTTVATPATTPPPATAPSEAVGIPAEVTPDMEQAFLTKYKTAVEKPDPDAFFALYAFDPKLDAKVKAEMKGLYLFPLAMVSSNPNRTYTFVPITSGDVGKPTPFKGKMYGAYLPPVLSLKITFAKPENAPPKGGMAVGDSTVNLCIVNHQLQMVGVKEIPGMVPPPAINQADNYGIEPKLHKFTNAEAADGGDGFISLDGFLSSLKQPGVEVLTTGDTKFAYYAICRIAPNLCVVAQGDKKGQGNYSFVFVAKDANGQELKGKPKWIRLVDIPTDNGQAPCVQGTVFEVPDHYTGRVTVDGQYRDDGGEKAAFFTQAVEWK